MTRTYDVTTHRPAAPGSAGPSLRVSGLLCIAGAVIAAVGATVEGTVTPAVSSADLSFPFEPTTFRLTEVLWALTHLLTLVGVLGLARSGLVGRSRLGSAGLRTTAVGMALLVPGELAFAAAADVAADSTTAVVLGSAMGLAATLTGVGFVLTGAATLREGTWTGWGRWTPLLCGMFVIAVLLPVQALRPSAFLWPIAGWNVCLALFGLALAGAAVSGSRRRLAA
jgi:hypothetical protein